MSTTANLAIAKIDQSQAQKEVTANAGFDILDQAIAGLLSKSVAGSSNVNLTATEATNEIIVLTGLLTGNIEVRFPTAGARKSWIIWNNTTGAYTVKLLVLGQTGVTITQGNRALVLYNGTDISGVNGL